MPFTGQTQLRTSSEEHFQMRKMQVSLCLSSKQKAELQEKNHRKSSQASSLLNVHNAECVKAVKKTKNSDTRLWKYAGETLSSPE